MDPTKAKDGTESVGDDVKQSHVPNRVATASKTEPAVSDAESHGGDTERTEHDHCQTELRGIRHAFSRISDNRTSHRNDCQSASPATTDWTALARSHATSAAVADLNI